MNAWFMYEQDGVIHKWQEEVPDISDRLLFCPEHPTAYFVFSGFDDEITYFDDDEEPLYRRCYICVDCDDNDAEWENGDFDDDWYETTVICDDKVLFYNYADHSGEFYYLKPTPGQIALYERKCLEAAGQLTLFPSEFQ